MAIQQADRPQEPRSKDLFPLWVRISAFVLCLILLVGAAAVWLSKVWGSDLSNVMSAIFGVLGAIFGFIALLPFFFHLSDNTGVSTRTTPSGPAQVINNFFGSPPSASPQPAQPLTTSDNQAVGTQSSASDNIPPDQQQSSGDGRAVHEPPSPPPTSPPSAPSSPSTRSGAAKRNVLDYTLHQRLVRALEGIPAAVTFEGRTTLLSGLPRNIVASLNRDRNNDANDLESLLTQLDALGPLATGEQPLVIFIRNALRRAEGLDTYPLNLVLEELKRRYA